MKNDRNRPKRSVKVALEAKYKAWPSLRLYDQLEIPYVVVIGKPHGTFTDWPGPTWTGHCMILDNDDNDYGDPLAFHELCHWLAASERQRRLPDFGIDRQVNSSAQTFTSSSTPFLYDAVDDDKYRGWGEQCISGKRSGQQEDSSCAALYFYEPATGLCDWNDPISSEVRNSAYYDFQGPQGFNWNSRLIERVQRILSPLGITHKNLTTYVNSQEETEHLNV